MVAVMSPKTMSPLAFPKLTPKTLENSEWKV
jgi:hypothetical protein